MPEDLEVAGLFYKLIRLPAYEQALRRYRKLDLSPEERAALRQVAQAIKKASAKEA